MAAGGVESTGPPSWEAVRVPAADHDVLARVYYPRGPRLGWLVWAHGGSWTGGSAEAWHPACADLARLAGCTLVSVDYRLAPRYPHPAASDDVMAVMAWADARACRDNDRVAVGGDSAGGTIAACVALILRDQGRRLAAQLLAYPPLDPSCRAPSYTRHPDGFPTREEMIAAWRRYRGTDIGAGGAAGDRAHRTYSTPFEAGDLRALAPALLGVGELDPTADDVRTYARRLRTAGNLVELREFPAMRHGAFLRPAESTETGRPVRAENPLRLWLGERLRHLFAAPTPDSGSPRQSRAIVDVGTTRSEDL
jgi:acetyl esterase